MGTPLVNGTGAEHPIALHAATLATAPPNGQLALHIPTSTQRSAVVLFPTSFTPNVPQKKLTS
jgi:hypothetical protein